MSGIQEILVLAGVVAAVLFGPRLKGLLMNEGAGAAPPVPSRRRRGRLSGAMRLAIVGSVLFPVAAAVYFAPWHGNVRPFVAIGLGPVGVGWCAWWVCRGFAKGNDRG